MFAMMSRLAPNVVQVGDQQQLVVRNAQKAVHHVVSVPV